jgi:putative flavoprotein involved in K+ transport
MSETLEAPSLPASSGPSAGDVASRWLAAFGAALEQRDIKMVEALFLPHGWWRDLLAFTWDLRTFQGTDRITGALATTLEAARPSGFRLTEGKDPVLVEADENTKWVQAFFDFDTAVARGSGFFRDRAHDDGHAERL